MIFVISLGLMALSTQQNVVAKNNLPATTGSAADVVTLPFKISNMMPTINPDGTFTPVSAPIVTFKITGKDLDTYTNAGIQGATNEVQLPDAYLSCKAGFAAKPNKSGPSFRGTAPDGTATWDVVVEGILIPMGTPPGSSPTNTVYINTYILYNPTNMSGRSPLLNDPDLTVDQTIIQPGY